MNAVFAIIKLKYKILSLLSPRLAAKDALKLFQKPHNFKIREREKEFLMHSEVCRLKHEPEDLIFYRKGNLEGKKVLMIHGWDSNPGSMAAIADQLIDQGYDIYAYNVPAHGISSEKRTNMLDVADKLVKAMKHLNGEKKLNIVTHSFGSGAISFALQKSKIEIDKAVFITSPDKLIDIFKEFSDKIGMSKLAFLKMLQLTEQRFKLTFYQMEVSKLLKESKINELLLIHDVDDKILPFRNAENIKNANKKIELHSTHGKGHYRILWDEEVIEKIGHFMEN